MNGTGVEDRERSAIVSGSERPELLYLAQRVPYPPDKGDRIRSYHLLRMLADHARVHLACLADEPIDRSAVNALRTFCSRVDVVRLGSQSRWVRALGSLASGRTVSEGAFDSPRLRTTLRRWAAQTMYHAAIASSSSMAPYLRMPELRGIPSVIDLVDVDSQKWFDYARHSRGPRAWLYRTEGQRLRRLEGGLSDWARAITLVSEDEAAIYRSIRTTDSVHAITNGVDIDYFQPSPVPERLRCVFVGALDYAPNVDALLWFCREVWPAVRHLHPTASLAMVGRRPATEVRRLAGPEGVELVGQVPDVRPYVAEAAVAIAPLRIARGVQNKVLEALAMGKAVVASPEALTGLGAQPGVHLLVASDPREWVAAISRLLLTPDLRARLGREGRCYVEASHRWDQCLEPFVPLLGLPRHDTLTYSSSPRIWPTADCTDGVAP